VSTPKPLSVMLDEIERKALDERKPVKIEHSNGRGDMGEDYEIAPAIQGSAVYTLPLVKALREYRERFLFELNLIVPDSPTKQGAIEQLMFEIDADIAAILNQKQQDFMSNDRR
jgi:hypothetical protein